MRFIITDPNDFIQSHWTNNQFYEQAELSYTQKFIPSHGVIIDVGANVGNHAMFFDKMFSPVAVYVIEPNPDAYMVMLMNSALNHCHSIRFDYLGIALSDKDGFVQHKETVDGNLGATSYKDAPEGIQCTTGDKLFSEIEVDFIKIDVEGMEFNVLAGFEKTIARCRPYIYIEVLNKSIDVFENWLEEHNYGIIERVSVYGTYTNYLIAHQSNLRMK